MSKGPKKWNTKIKAGVDLFKNEIYPQIGRPGTKAEIINRQLWDSRDLLVAGFKGMPRSRSGANTFSFMSGVGELCSRGRDLKKEADRQEFISAAKRLENIIPEVKREISL